MHPTPPCILSIAGTDSGGGAGIQADSKTTTILGGFALSVVAALTAQNGLGVTGIQPIPPDFVRLQLQTVRDGFPVAAAKTGMLFSSAIIECLADALADKSFPLVVDPVCVSQSGHSLLQEDAVAALRKHFFPLADLLTPNRPEAELLAGMPIHTEADVQTAAERLLGYGAKAVLIKGGHFESGPLANHKVMTDWLCLPGAALKRLHQPRVDTKHNHGTGCTLSAAIATFLGLGHTLESAVVQAQRYLNLCLRAAYAPGKGLGPACHAAPFLDRHPLHFDS